MQVGGRRILVCDCEHSMKIDAAALARALGTDQAPFIHSELCGAQINQYEDALTTDVPLTVCCTQQAPLFQELATEAAERPGTASPDIDFVNIRERAGWGVEGKAALPKMAALIAEAVTNADPAGEVELSSDGVCLVYGRDERAYEAAGRLARRLDVTVLLDGGEDLAVPARFELPILKGRISRASGHLGAFEIGVDGYATPLPSSRGVISFGAGRDGAVSRCDLILDLSGGTPLFPSHARRDGYVRVDPSDAVAVERAIGDLAELVGTFSKPRYVTTDSTLCAHSRSRKTGCTRCLDLCPASAIRPAGDHVEIDPYLCGGCGACSSVCPTGAVNYAYPGPSALIERGRVLLKTYRNAQDKKAKPPVVLIHDSGEGAGTLDAIAHYGSGLPAHVLPMAINEVTVVGPDLLFALIAYGAAGVVLLAPPAKRDEVGGLAAHIGLVETVLSALGHGSGRVHLVIENDPDAVADQLSKDFPVPTVDEPVYFLSLGDTMKRRARPALDRLHRTAPTPTDTVPLLAGAPFGRVNVDVEGCTLCLACVGACPTGALIDNPDTPQLSFLEDACIQCGLCRNTCPESVISLEPRLAFGDAPMMPVVIKEEPPFECIRCGKPFATRSAIERISAQLAEKHSMYATPAAAERLKMCEDCRVVVQFEDNKAPFAMGPRPLPRTTDDYLREREAASAPAREPEIEAARAQIKADRENEDESGKA